MIQKSSVLILILVFLSSISLSSENIIYPSDANVYNVKTAGAKGNGIYDDTEVIQGLLDAHMSENAVIYFPNGTYKVSSTLYWGPSTDRTNCGSCWKRIIFQGQSRDGVIIQLADNSFGFNNPSAPLPVIWTGIKPAQRFRNGIRNMTINTGKGNPGACGIQYMSNNQGSCENIKIVSGDGAGVNGLDLRYTDENGPLLIKHITVEGFDYGININCLNSAILEDISLSGQKVCGLKNINNVVAIRKLVSNNTVRAIDNSGGNCYMVLMDATLTGATTGAAINNSGMMYARNISRAGYTTLLNNTAGTGLDVAGTEINEFCSHSAKSPFGAAAIMLNLPVKETPEVPWEQDMSKWVNPESYGARGNDSNDDTPGLQAAIDVPGKSTLYLPGGKTYYVNGTLYVRGSISRIIGCEGRIQGTGTIVIQDGTAPVIALERFDAMAASINIKNETSRTVVIKGISSGGLSSNSGDFSSTGSGDFYLEDISNGRFAFYNASQHIWGRQINPEAGDKTNIINNGATLWIMMLKTERDQIKVQTNNGGKTEILGVHNYSAQGPVSGDLTPYFEVNNSSFSVACYRETNNHSSPYNVYVKEVQGTTTNIFSRSNATEGGSGNSGAKGIALYVGKKIINSISTLESSEGMNVYPNPVRSTLNIKLTDLPLGKLHVNLYNSMSQLVRSMTAEKSDLSMNVQDLANGMYFVTLESNTKKAVKKIIVNN